MTNICASFVRQVDDVPSLPDPVDEGSGHNALPEMDERVKKIVRRLIRARVSQSRNRRKAYIDSANTVCQSTTTSIHSGAEY